MASGRRWQRDEILAAFALYMRIPSSRLSYEEDENIIALAGALGRTEGSVAILLQNLLAYDPCATRKGLDKASSKVRAIWPEYAERGDDLVAEAIRAYDLIMTGVNTSTIKKRQDMGSPRAGLDSPSMTTRRLNQEYFRKSLIDLYGGKCCVTGLGTERLLIASHIKPWKDSDPVRERTNVENGLLLNALHDKAFDEGYITLNEKFEIVFSQILEEQCRRALEARVDTEVYEWLWNTRARQIRLPKKHRPSLEFIRYHNLEIFLDTIA